MKEDLFNIHLNFHYDPELMKILAPGEEFPAGEKEFVEAFSGIDFGYIQIGAKGHPGYPTWPSKFGPKPKSDYMGLWRKACDKLGVGLVAYYCSGIVKVEGLRHPGWAQRNADGSPLIIGTDTDWSSMCFNSPYADEVVIPELLDLIRRYRVEGFWIDGDGFGHSLCHCDACKKAFAKRYPGDKFPSSENSPSYMKAVSLYRETALAYMRKVHDAVKKENSACWLTFIWAYSASWPRDPENVDFISFDTAQDFCETRANFESRYLGAREDGPHEIMPFCVSKSWGSRIDGNPTSRQLRPLRTLLMEEATILANGCKWNLITWPSASGHLMPQMVSHVRAAAEFFKRREKHFSGSKSVPLAAILISEHAAERFAPAMNQNIFGGNSQFSLPMEGAASILNSVNMHFDIVNEKTLLRKALEYQLLIVPDLEFSPELDGKLREFVKRGGTLIASHEALLRHAPDGSMETALKDVFGVELVAAETTNRKLNLFDFACVDHHGEPVPAHYQPFMRARSAGAETTDWLRTDWRMSGKIAPYVFVNSFGKGKAVYISGAFFKWALEYHPAKLSWFKELVAKNLADFRLKVKASPRVAVSYRRKGDDGLLHLVNQERLGPAQGILSDDILTQRNIYVSLLSDTEPESITLEPEGERLSWERNGCQIELTVPRLDIHSVIVLKNIFRANGGNEVRKPS